MSRRKGLAVLDDTFSHIAAIAGCLLLSALSAATETALVALGDMKTGQLVKEGNRALRLWQRHPERVIATLLVANNIANTLSAALMTELMTNLGSPNAIAIATGVMTFLILAFGDVTPKALAMRYASTVAPLLMPLAWLLYYALYPVVRLFGAIPIFMNTLFRRGQVGDGEAKSVTTEEIEYMIDLGVREGVLDREKSQLFSRVLEFTNIVTREIMVPRQKVVGIPHDATKEEVLKVIVESEHSRIPVYEESIDQIVGVLYVKTLLADLEMGRLQGPFDIKRYTKPPYFVPEQMMISRLLREFQQRKVHLAVVVDEFGGTSGVVALEDVVEEIVGEIQDEQDVDEARLKILPDGTVIADASITLRSLEDHLKIDFPDELDADSLGGFITATAGRVPPVGSVVLWGGLRFTVRAGDERRVARVEITRPRDPGKGASPQAPDTAAARLEVPVVSPVSAEPPAPDERPEVFDANTERRDA